MRCLLGNLSLVPVPVTCVFFLLSPASYVTDLVGSSNTLGFWRGGPLCMRHTSIPVGIETSKSKHEGEEERTQDDSCHVG